MTGGHIPISAALAEASPESLTELFSRDPESYQQQDIKRIVEALRAQRERWKAAEGGREATAKKAKQPKVAEILSSKPVELDF